jgi:hypothetical protein
MEFIMLNQSVRVVCEPTHRGTLKLFTDVKIDRGEDSDTRYYRNMFKRLTLATHYGVDLKTDCESYIEEFKDLNPAFADVAISYEFVLRKFG